MADEMLRVAGRSPSGLAKAVKTDEEGNLSVGIKGSEIQNLVSHVDNTTLLTNNFAFVGAGSILGRGTSITSGFDGYKRIDVSKHPKRLICIDNKHDQPIVLVHLIASKELNGTSNDNLLGLLDKEIVINSGDRLTLTGVTYPLLDTPYPYLYMCFGRDSVAPTNGNIIITIFGGAF